MENLERSYLQFKNPIVKEISYQRNMSFDKRQPTLGFLPKASVDVNFHDNNKATVSMTFAIGTEDSINPYFSFKAIASAEFMWEETKREKAEKQLKISAPAMLLSYIRPLLANLTTQSGLPPYQLPFIDFTQIK